MKKFLAIILLIEIVLIIDCTKTILVKTEDDSINIETNVDTKAIYQNFFSYFCVPFYQILNINI